MVGRSSLIETKENPFFFVTHALLKTLAVAALVEGKFPAKPEIVVMAYRMITARCRPSPLTRDPFISPLLGMYRHRNEYVFC